MLLNNSYLGDYLARCGCVTSKVSARYKLSRKCAHIVHKNIQGASFYAIAMLLQSKEEFQLLRILVNTSFVKCGFLY